MKLFVGLGNPGSEYEGTRHNIGFSAIDKFADLANGAFDRSDFKGLYGLVKNPSFPESILILKPQTFMNLSGQSVKALADFYKIDIQDIVIVYDDMALPEGSLRLRLDGSSGGHKGMQNIIEQLATQNIKRIRIGIGEPPHKDAINYVLGKAKGDSAIVLEEATSLGAKALRDIALGKEFSNLMSVYNVMKKE